MAVPLHRSLFNQAAIAAVAAMGTFAVLTGSATPVQAQPASAAYYQARLAAPLAAARTEIVGGVAWTCAGDSCTAAKGTSRPEVVCGRLIRKFGSVSSFVAAGAPLEAASLAKCNREDAAVLTRRDAETPARP
ncbi:MAG: hypothetical protein ABW194_03815 [Novosphingobium sp.]